jgi:hypothetical protein
MIIWNEIIIIEKVINILVKCDINDPMCLKTPSFDTITWYKLMIK